MQINLLPWREQARQRRKIQFLAHLSIYIAGTLGLVMVLHLYYAGLIHHETKRIDYLNTVLGERTSAFQTEKEEKKKQDLTEKALEFLASLRQENYRTMRFLNALTVLTPDNITLDKLAKINHHIVLIGRAPTELPITQFMQNLDKSPEFNQPVLTRINKNADTLISNRVFELQVDQKIEEGKA